MTKFRGRYAALVAATLVLAACQSGSSTGPNTGPIAIGFNGELTGNFAPDGLGALEGVQVGVDAVNAAGGVLGRQLTIVTGDNRGDPVDAVPVAQQQINLNNIVASVGPSGAFMVPCQRYYDRAGVATFMWGGDPEWDNITDPLMWRVTPSDSELSVAMAYFAWTKGYRKAALMFESNTAEQGLKADVSKAWQHLGGTVAASVDLAIGESSYRSEVQTVTNAHPDVIFLAMGVSGAGVLFANMRELNGLSIPVVGDDKSHAPEFISAIGAAASQKALVSLDAGTYDSPSAKFFNDLYVKQEGHAPLGNGAYTYDAIVVLALAMALAQTTDGGKATAAIPRITDPNGQKVNNYADGLAAIKAGAKSIKYVGASGPLDFNQHHNVFGPFAAYVSTDTHGKLQLLVNFTAEQLQAAAQ